MIILFLIYLDKILEFIQGHLNLGIDFFEFAS